MTTAPPPVLQVEDLQTHFFTQDGQTRAVDGVSFQVKAGETLGIVGESGCGKSVTALSILRLLPPRLGRTIGGSVRFDGQELLTLDEKEMRKIRGNRIAMIFQEPMTSLNPVLTIGDQIAEAVVIHQGKSRTEAMERAIEMLRVVRIPDPERRVQDYPHLTIQAQILKLMVELKSEIGAAIMLITHDLGVVAETCQRVIVMYAGKVVEEAEICELFDRPLHPYTRGLMASIPRLKKAGARRLSEIPGIVPNLREPIGGCAFAPRCTLATDRCRTQAPTLQAKGADHRVACFEADRVAS